MDNSVWKLTRNFSLDELTCSDTASRLHIDNKVNFVVIKNLQNLCYRVLQPLRNHYGKPIIISSGYRCRVLNDAVGGAPLSQHMRGEAADIVFPNLKTAEDWIMFIRNHCVFDQLFLEHKAGTNKWWIHVSCRQDVKANRMEYREITVKPNCF